MLSDRKIIELIKKYHKTSEGKEMIEDYKIVYSMSKPKSFSARYAKSGIKPMTKKRKKEIAEDMADILHRHIISDTASKHGDGLKSFERSSIIVKSSLLDDGSTSMKVLFDKNAIHRDSLVPDVYDGVDDIIRLFEKGYTAHGSVKGVWATHGAEAVWSLKHRDPNDFMNAAVSEFNRKHWKEAKAELSDNYK